APLSSSGQIRASDFQLCSRSPKDGPFLASQSLLQWLSFAFPSPIQFSSSRLSPHAPDLLRQLLNRHIWDSKFRSISIPNSCGRFSSIVGGRSYVDLHPPKGFLAPSFFPREHPSDDPPHVVVRSSRMSRRFVLAR